MTTPIAITTGSIAVQIRWNTSTTVDHRLVSASFTGSREAFMFLNAVRNISFTGSSAVTIDALTSLTLFRKSSIFVVQDDECSDQRGDRSDDDTDRPSERRKYCAQAVGRRADPADEFSHGRERLRHLAHCGYDFSDHDERRPDRSDNGRYFYDGFLHAGA